MFFRHDLGMKGSFQYPTCIIRLLFQLLHFKIYNLESVKIYHISYRKRKKIKKQKLPFSPFLVNGGTFTAPGGAAAARSAQHVPVHDEDDLFGSSAAIDELETFGKGKIYPGMRIWYFFY